MARDSFLYQEFNETVIHPLTDTVPASLTFELTLLPIALANQSNNSDN